MIDYYQCPICLVSVFDCKHRDSRGVKAQLEQRIKRYDDARLLRCTGSRSERIWKIIDELGNY